MEWYLYVLLIIAAWKWITMQGYGINHVVTGTSIITLSPFQGEEAAATQGTPARIRHGTGTCGIQQQHQKGLASRTNSARRASCTGMVSTPEAQQCTAVSSHIHTITGACTGTVENVHSTTQRGLCRAGKDQV